MEGDNMETEKLRILWDTAILVDGKILRVQAIPKISINRVILKIPIEYEWV
jgi:hypothetical protein